MEEQYVPVDYDWAANIIRTGENCPATGWWRPVQSETAGLAHAPRFVGKGCVMPSLDGEPYQWVLSQGRGR